MGRKAAKGHLMKNAKTQSLIGFEANPSFNFTIRDDFPGEVE